MPPPKATVGSSCDKCPSFLKPRQQDDLVGSNVNGPLCGKKMLPLLMPSQDKDAAKRLLAHTAKICSMYGDEFEGEKLAEGAAPLMPVGMDTNPATPALGDSQAMASCRSCVNYISETDVYEKTKWTGGICRATGALMPTNLTNAYAARCGSYVRQVGLRSRNPFATFTLFPGFLDSFGKVDAAASYRLSLKNFTDPRDWVNERWTGTPNGAPELSPARLDKMKQHNIRAYRRITDPDGYGQEVFLPVYDYNNWPDDLKMMVPVTGDDEHPELYADHGQILYTMAVLWLKLDETPALWGQPGTGKTEFLRHMAWLMCAPFTRISISGSSEVDDIIGKMLFLNGETLFHYGRLTKAWENPGVLLLDEPNTGQPEIWQILRPLTDNSRTLVVDQATSKVIRRNSDCYFGMAMNPAWDPRNVGTQTLGDADGSRLMHIFFDYPPRDLEIEIVQRRCGLDGFEVPRDQMEALMKVTEELRTMSMDQEIHVTWGVRNTIKVARALAWFSPLKAFRHAVIDSLEPGQMEMIMSVVKSQFGE